MKSESIWTTAVTALDNEESITLVTVVEHHGSVPGTTGAMMIVTPGAVAGTVGGGLVEHELIEMARRGPQAQLFAFSHDGETSDSVCSGDQLFAILPLSADHRMTLTTLENIHRNCSTGTLILTDKGLKAKAGRPKTGSFTRTGNSWSFVMPIGRIDTLTIVGGGHVSLALSRVMATLPFRIVVLDDRAVLPTLENNQWAHEIRHIRWDDVANQISEGENSWVVIMTSGHRHDTDVLQRVIRLDLRYLGMMGSSAKVREVFSVLESEGFSKEELRRAHTPIGIQIGSHTPEEIAISIAAEIIQERNRS
ncbi:MAG: XdhC family protein [Thermoanaerobaculales bacterium]|nr:XdhC family protein [Thermoanaerobaculales bacterium]